jgi:hypothetical protein
MTRSRCWGDCTSTRRRGPHPGPRRPAPDCQSCPGRRVPCLLVRANGVVDWLFRNRLTGEVTIAQWPNAPLLVFLGAWALDQILDPSGWFGSALGIVATGALAVWALDELLRGVNPWRRLLGFGVLCLLAMRLFIG